MVKSFNNTLQVIFVVTVFVSFIGLTFYTHHDFLGGADQGSYTAMGKVLSKGGYFVFKDEILKENIEYRHSKLFMPHGFGHYGGEGSIKVMTYWNKGYPLLSVPFWWLDEFRGWQYVNPLLGGLSLLLVYLILVRLGYPTGGVPAVAMFSTSWLQLWHSRYPFSEITSQFLFLLSFYFLLKFFNSQRRRYLFISSFTLCYSIFTHFGNYPLIGVFFFWALLTITLKENFKIKKTFLSKSYFKQLFIYFFLLVVLPVLTFVIYWKIDPGIQRYSNEVAVSAGMGFDTSSIGSFVKSFVIRIGERYLNLAIYVHHILIIGGVVGLFYLMVVDKKNRFTWISLIALGLVSLIIYASRGVGNPHTIFVARRNVPFILPIIFIVVGASMDYIQHSGRFGKFKKSLTPLMVLFVIIVVVYQSILYSHFLTINTGKDMPYMAKSVRKQIIDNGTTLKNSIVFLNGPATLFEAGLRYVYDVPIMASPFFKKYALKMLKREINGNKGLYILNFNKLKKVYENEFTTLTLQTFPLPWYDPNIPGPFEFPTTKWSTLNYTLYKVLPPDKPFDVTWAYMTWPFLSDTGRMENNAIYSTGRQGHLLYGPYVTLPRGKYKVTFYSELLSPSKNSRVVLDVVSSKEKKIHSQKILHVSNKRKRYWVKSLKFSLDEKTDHIEFRIYTDSKINMKIYRVRLVRSD